MSWEIYKNNEYHENPHSDGTCIKIMQVLNDKQQ